jgi:hypothetical protein
MIGYRKALFVLCSVVLSGSAFSAMAQINPREEPLDAKISSFDLVGQTIYGGLARLMNEPVPLSFGFESVLKAKFADPEVQDVRFNLALQNKSVREILDGLCSMDVRYTWSQDGATINVYPRETVGTSSYLLNRRLDTWEITDITDVQYGLLAIVQQLPGPREQLAIAQIGGSSSYPNAWTGTFQNITVRQAVNRIAGQLGPRTYWHLSGSREFRSFSFFKIGEHPRAN